MSFRTTSSLKINKFYDRLYIYTVFVFFIIKKYLVIIRSKNKVLTLIVFGTYIDVE